MPAAAVSVRMLYLVAGIALLAPSAGAAGDAQKAQLDEVIVTHSRMGPLSEWARMQAHEADYQRLKAQFDPTQPVSRVDQDTADRNASKPAGQQAPQEMQEMESSGKSPIIQEILPEH